MIETEECDPRWAFFLPALWVVLGLVGYLGWWVWERTNGFEALRLYLMERCAPLFCAL